MVHVGYGTGPKGCRIPDLRMMVVVIYKGLPGGGMILIILRAEVVLDAKVLDHGIYPLDFQLRKRSFPAHISIPSFGVEVAGAVR